MASPPELHLRNQICHSLYSATLALTRAYRQFLDPLDLTYPQYIVMLAVWEHAPCSVSELCTSTRLDTGTITPLLKRLEAKGFIVRGRSADDERRRVISVTPAGSTLADSAADIPYRMACLGVLGAEDAVELKRLSEALYTALEHGKHAVDQAAARSVTR